MKNNFNAKCLGALLLTSVVIMSMFSCSKEDHHPGRYYDSVLHLPLETIKGFYKGEDVVLDEGHDFEAVNVNGIIISDAAGGNQPHGLLFLQDGETGVGIRLTDAASAEQFKEGDSVKVNLSGGTLTKEEGNLIITGIAATDITVLQTGKKAAPNSVTLKTLFNNFDQYSGSLVQIFAAEVRPEPAEGETYSGSKGLYDASGEAGQVQLFTSPESTLAGVEISDSAINYTGIATYGLFENSQDSLVKQIWLRNTGDIEVTKVVAVNSPIIITGFLANPRGSDEKVKGDKTEYSSGTVIVHKGGYEYIQLMALEDIDFSKTPYSVVTCNNTSAKKGGWAEGGTTTFKFNLTEGVAKAGTFFYVGAAAKVICAYWPDGLSTDISGANWIRSLQVYTHNENEVTGDGFGNSINSFLGNSSAADGIAVFEGTEVTPASIPLDAVFFNPPVEDALKDGNGYQVPDNDLYSRTNPETGQAQPLFGQGTNTYALEGPGEDNHFAIMGGIISENGWLVPRDPSTKVLNIHSQLSDIESGPGVTVFRK